MTTMARTRTRTTNLQPLSYGRPAENQAEAFVVEEVRYNPEFNTYSISEADWDRLREVSTLTLRKGFEVVHTFRDGSRLIQHDIREFSTKMAG